MALKEQRSGRQILPTGIGSYSAFDQSDPRTKPPKCYFDTEKEIVDWVMQTPFERGEVAHFTTARDDGGRPKNRSLDCSLMECADDIAYGVHDLEDIVARRLVRKNDVMAKLEAVFEEHGPIIGMDRKAVSFEDFDKQLFEDTYKRKALIGKLVNLFVTSVNVRTEPGFSHPLLCYRVAFDRPVEELVNALKSLALKLVVQRAEVQQLERRGQRIVSQLFAELIRDPQQLIPKSSWQSLNEVDSIKRRVCDYIAGMTDPFAERIYQRIFIPGFGSSYDEL